MLRGSCLCGAVAYEADAGPGPIVHCHCQTCRKAHGAAFSSISSVPRSAFRWTRGEEHLGRYESSPGKVRQFCRQCGSQLVAQREGQPTVMLRMGCVDTPSAGTPISHIWRSDGADWYDPQVLLPEYPEGMPPRA